MSLSDPAAIAAATHPVRAAILDAMREPSTAAAVARVVGQSRQNVAYHVRELEKVGLLRHVGQRQNGNFIEQTYVAVADTLVISPASTWGDARRRLPLPISSAWASCSQRASDSSGDSAVLLDRAAFDGDEVPSASVTTDIRRDRGARSAFLHDAVER